MTPTCRAVFLDRDGVLNRAIVRNGKPYPPASAGELEILPGVPEALARLRQAGFVLLVITNQPDVARGTTRRETVEAINEALRRRLPLDAVYTCYEDGDTPRRKPNPGLLLEAAAEHGVDPRASFMVGDRWKDVEAGRRAGCRTVFVDYGYREAYLAAALPDRVVADLGAAADWIVTADGADRPTAFKEEANHMNKLENLHVKIYADGADKAGMLHLYANPLIKGFTTNPTLMRKAGVADYEAFAQDILRSIPDRPISFEVFSDDFGEMEEQAGQIASWGSNVYVKIPVTNTRGQSAAMLIRRLAAQRVPLNVTALFTLEQVEQVCMALAGQTPAVVSVFAGRVADAGVDPVPLMSQAKKMVEKCRQAELLWASPRELLNILQADEVGCDIITVTHDMLAKLGSIGKDLDTFSLETVKMFRDDAVKAGFALQRRKRAAG